MMPMNFGAPASVTSNTDAAIAPPKLVARRNTTLESATAAAGVGAC